MSKPEWLRELWAEVGGPTMTYTSRSNPILAAIRDAGGDLGFLEYFKDRTWFYRFRAEWSRWPGVSESHIAHATKVLNRLAVFADGHERCPECRTQTCGVGRGL